MPEPRTLRLPSDRTLALIGCVVLSAALVAWKGDAVVEWLNRPREAVAPLATELVVKPELDWRKYGTKLADGDYTVNGVHARDVTLFVQFGLVEWHAFPSGRWYLSEIKEVGARSVEAESAEAEQAPVETPVKNGGKVK